MNVLTSDGRGLYVCVPYNTEEILKFGASQGTATLCLDLSMRYVSKLRKIAYAFQIYLARISRPSRKAFILSYWRI